VSPGCSTPCFLPCGLRFGSKQAGYLSVIESPASQALKNIKGDHARVEMAAGIGGHISYTRPIRECRRCEAERGCRLGECEICHVTFFRFVFAYPQYAMDRALVTGQIIANIRPMTAPFHPR
jgi:hypothetical protein